MITAGNRGYGAWRDGGFTVHDLSDPAKPKLISHINWSPPFPGGTHTPLAVAGPKARGRRRRSECRKNAPRACSTRSSWICGRQENPVPISTLPTPKERDFCGLGTFGPHNLHENRPGTFRSEETIFATYNDAGVASSTSRTRSRPRKSPPGCRRRRRS